MAEDRRPGEFLFPGRSQHNRYLTTRAVCPPGRFLAGDGTVIMTGDDILAVQQQAETVPWGQILDDLPEKLVLASACPVLMVPLARNVSAKGEHVLIA